MIPRYITNFDLAEIPRVYTDFLIVGSGIAGLYTALKAYDGGKVTILTKRRLEDSNTDLAQGGIAAAIGTEDTPRLHLADTLEAGAGLCDLEAVEVLVNEGPDCVMELVEIGTRFDRIEGQLALTREGAHRQRRILHARGDATGEEIRRALSDQVALHPEIDVHEDVYIIDLLTEGDVCYGALAWDLVRRQKVAYLARATVIATGGAGHLYQNTTNPEVATGDGIAASFRAGARLADLEFIQFHPTALYHEGNPKFLVSEAVRGEGAILRNSQGEAFMSRYHPMADLAPRDVVARAIVEEMRRTGEPAVYLDTTKLSIPFAQRFPTIYQRCRQLGLDPTRDWIPVAPAAHYIMGGIRTDVDGQTNLSNLYACGEAACTGVHGANRLASNSLLEGLVFGKRIALRMKEKLDKLSLRQLHRFTARSQDLKGELPYEAAWGKRQLQSIMWQEVGILRDGEGLERARQAIGELAETSLGRELEGVAAWEMANLVTLGGLVALAAARRQESRGAHYRTDFPQRDDQNWQRHIFLRRVQGEPALEE